MTETLIWVIGGGGFLGSHMRRALSQHVAKARFWESAPRHFSWSDSTRLAGELSHAVATFAEAVRAQANAWVLLWCAGTGVMGSSLLALEPEWMAWIRLLDLLGRHLAGPRGDVPGSIFLASSAGGIYGGSLGLGRLLTEDTPSQPITDYGAHKLRMEEALLNWAHAFPNISTLIGRISSLYGPGQDLHKAQGVISHLSRCLIYRHPVNIYVPLDTRGDYLFADDCAHQIAASLGRLVIERPRAILKIFASEELTSLGRIVGIFLRLAKHRPLIVLSQQPRRNARLTSMKLRSSVWRDLEGLRQTDLATGIHLVHEHQMAVFCRGLLPPP
jgi:UDP-glucose 4-epimerase